MAIKKVKLKNMSGDQLIPDVGIPSQAGNNGKVLGTNGSSLQFVDMPTVTSTYTATGTDAVNGVAVSNAIATKQDNLVSGTNIKTINGTSLLGSGNIDIQGGGSSYTAGDGIIIENNEISVDGQSTNEVDTETVSEATLATVATSGSYADLSNTPTVDQVYDGTSPNAQSGIALASVIGNIEALLANI